MSTIAAGTSSGTALVSTGDTTGTLVLQTNGTTTAVTIGTNQVVTLAQPLPVASGGTGGSATPTAGGVVYGTGTVQAVSAAGTSGQVLQSNGASAPSWITASASALTLLSTVTATAASTLLVNSGFTSTYDTYDLVVYGTASNNNAAIRLRYELGGSVISTSTYQFRRFDNSLTGDSADSSAPSTDASILNVGNDAQAAGNNFTVVFRITNPSSTTRTKLITWTGASVRLEISMNEGVVLNQAVTALTGVQLYPDGGTITATARLYGYAKI